MGKYLILDWFWNQHLTLSYYAIAIVWLLIFSGVCFIADTAEEYIWVFFVGMFGGVFISVFIVISPIITFIVILGLYLLHKLFNTIQKFKRRYSL